MCRHHIVLVSSQQMVRTILVHNEIYDKNFVQNMLFVLLHITIYIRCYVLLDSNTSFGLFTETSRECVIFIPTFLFIRYTIIFRIFKMCFLNLTYPCGQNCKINRIMFHLYVTVYTKI